MAKTHPNAEEGDKKKGKWNLLVSGIVRPPRKLYELDDLGNPHHNVGTTSFVHNGKFFYRKDFEVLH